MTSASVVPARGGGRGMKTKPYRILVASDATPTALGAIRLAAVLGRRRSASVHALIVSTPFPHTFPSPAVVAPPALLDADNRRDALESLRFQLGNVRGTRDWAIRGATGFAAETIADAAQRWPASLVIMGRGEHGLFDRLVGSETTVKVASHATVPVLAVPSNAHELPTRAVAAVDFSESSVAAAHFAATLLGSRGTLTLLYASALITSEAPAGMVTDLYTAGARERLLGIADDIHRVSRRPVHVELATGGIVDRLLDFAEEKDCDLIALGAHEPTLFERLIAGRVRPRILRGASCSVLVAPVADAKRDD